MNYDNENKSGNETEFERMDEKIQKQGDAMDSAYDGTVTATGVADNTLTSAVISFQNGDSTAFDTIYNESKKYVYYTILKTTGDKDVADDILQETYLDVYRSLDQLQSPAAFKGWAATIAHRKIIRYFKNKNPELFSTEEEMVDAVGELTEDDMSALPEDAMINKEVQRLISEVIDELPENQKSVIVSFYYNQMSISEIAESMGVPENTVKTYLSRGRKRIREGVLNIEKKHGTKLYALPLAGLLGLLFAEEAKAAEVPASLTQLNTDLFNEAQAVNRNVFEGPKASGMIEDSFDKTIKSARAAGVSAKASGVFSGAAIRTIVLGVASGIVIGGGFTGAVSYAVLNSNEAELSEYEGNDDSKLILDADKAVDVDSQSDDTIGKMSNEETEDDVDGIQQDNTEKETAEESEADDKEIIPSAIEQKYINEAVKYLEQDDPLSAAEVLTAAMEEDYYPAVYEKLKEIRRNTYDYRTYSVSQRLDGGESKTIVERTYEGNDLTYTKITSINDYQTTIETDEYRKDEKGNRVHIFTGDPHVNYVNKGEKTVYVTESKEEGNKTINTEYIDVSTHIA